MQKHLICLKDGKNIIFDSVVINGVKMSKTPRDIILVKLNTH
ncbi:hypothetical protein SAMN06265371_11221 [Lutibacter agarilyticus]|uniref:Uncharacterized protein n=1 Tax=Lutibacter agarilyticus TaxID=1109740 RepID=A0A238Z2V7_9FLAO|nr:hypothetical protein SAMN06265371_11221 [Lutibacter agarilyticus]